MQTSTRYVLAALLVLGGIAVGAWFVLRLMSTPVPDIVPVQETVVQKEVVQPVVHRVATTTPTTTPTIVRKDTAPVALTPARQNNVAPRKEVQTSVLQVSPHVLQWGVYAGDYVEDLRAFEQLVGAEPDIVALFWLMGDEFPTYLQEEIGARGKTLLLYWESDIALDAIARGDPDRTIETFAQGAQTYGYPIILVPFNEMNIGETPWGYGEDGNTPATFKAVWRRMHAAFAEVPNVQFGLAYNNVSIPDIPENSFAAYYPGDDYVDIVGVDGFNFNDPWTSFEQTFDAALTELAAYDKPLMLFSTASASGPLKASWIQDGLGTVSERHPTVIGWVWFNLQKERDWRVNSEDESLRAFISILP